MDCLPISVVIATKNAEGTLAECLDSVQKNNPAEIIVVDGLSGDRTIEVARRYTQNIYSDEGKGFNYAQQFGVEQASQEYIALVDSDIVLPEGTLTKLLTELRSSDCVSMAARILAISLSNYWERAAGFLESNRTNGGLQATLLKRDILLKYKLDVNVKFASDYDFALRMKREGLKIGSSSAFAYHHNPVSIQSFVKQRVRFGSEATLYIRAYGPWHITFWPPITRAYWFALCLVKGKPNYIPYFIVDWAAQTVGMIKGFYRMI